MPFSANQRNNASFEFPYGIILEKRLTDPHAVFLAICKMA